MISGDKDMIVIDSQFSLSEAHRLAAEILESKKNLTTIYITHPHPDHFFGLAVLKQAFPNARAVALPATANAEKTAWPARQKFWFSHLRQQYSGTRSGCAGGADDAGSDVGGRSSFQSLGPVQGSDGPGNSFVYIPSLKAVVTGDIVFDHVYFGVPRGKAREDWSKTIDQITALDPAIIVPGHEGPGATRDMRSIQFMKKYIADWDANVASSKDAAEMKAKVLAQYPGLGMEFTLNDRIETYFPEPKQ